MKRKSLLARAILSPLALVYGTGVAIRKQLYGWGFFKSVKFDVPVISVGNLTTGGTGKTPHVEWLIRHLKPYIKVAILSRGYKRKSKGFHEVIQQHSASFAGDEPIQIKRKYPDVGVFVSENRLIGIPKVLAYQEGTQVIILDDAYQHLSVVPNINMLLTEYADLFVDDSILPMGNLRESKQAYDRADVIIVTKCPGDIRPSDMESVKEKLNLKHNQQLFFSKLIYGNPYNYFNATRISFQALENLSVLFISGIAKSKYLADFLEKHTYELEQIDFPDHHLITAFEWGQILKTYEQIPGDNKILICTEKDAVKFAPHREFLTKSNMKLYIMPVAVRFLPSDQTFWSFLKERLLEFKI